MIDETKISACQCPYNRALRASDGCSKKKAATKSPRFITIFPPEIWPFLVVSAHPARSDAGNPWPSGHRQETSPHLQPLTRGALHRKVMAPWLRRRCSANFFADGKPQAPGECHLNRKGSPSLRGMDGINSCLFQC